MKSLVLAFAVVMLGLSAFGQPVRSNPYTTNNTAAADAHVLSITGGGATNNTVSIESFGAFGGTNDDTIAFQAALRSGKDVTMNGATNYTSGNLIFTNNSHLNGNGATLNFKSSSSNFFLVGWSNLVNVAFRNIVLDGGCVGDTNRIAWVISGTNVAYNASGTARSGIQIASQMTNCILENVTCQNFNNRGFQLVPGHGSSLNPQYQSMAFRHCVALNDWVGIEWMSSAEYSSMAELQATYNGIGLLINAGNIQVIGGIYTFNGIGAMINGGTYTDANGRAADSYTIANEAHGLLLGCDFNHCDYGLSINNVTVGEEIKNCSFEGNGSVLPNRIILFNCTGVVLNLSQVQSTFLCAGDNGASEGGPNWLYYTGGQFVPTVVNGNGPFTQLYVNKPFAGDASSVTNLNASNIASGTVSDARLSANVTLNGFKTISGSGFTATPSQNPDGSSNLNITISGGSGNASAFTNLSAKTYQVTNSPSPASVLYTSDGTNFQYLVMNTNNSIVINTNFNTGQLYTNNYGTPIIVSANAILTTAGVVGLSQLALVVIGSITNYTTVLSAIGGLTGSMTNGIAPAFVPNGSTYYFTNTSQGAGDSSIVFGGQIIYMNPISSGGLSGNGSINNTVQSNVTFLAPFTVIGASTNVFTNSIFTGSVTGIPLSGISTNGVAPVVTNNVYVKIPWYVNAAGVQVYMLGFTNGP